MSSDTKSFPNNLTIEMLRGMIFNSKNDKYILRNYSANVEDVKL
jgi:hypothetical protein